jgi:hypothetical protein
MNGNLILCPMCGETFAHNCATEIGRRGKGVTSDRKRESSRRNMELARKVKAERKIIEKQVSE